MTRFENGLANFTFGANLLLLFLLLFEEYIHLPALIQVVGRTHPLILHLPIGMLFLLALAPLWRAGRQEAGALRLQRFAVHLVAITAVLTALAGLFLAQEGGYAADALNSHKWTGAGVSFLSYLLLLAARHRTFPAGPYYWSLYTVTGLLVAAGHLGGNITHGEDFLLAPLQPPQPPVTPATPVFQAAIRPVLEGKCVTCHNPRKSKGELIMTSEEDLLHGGENGPIWMAGQPEDSEIIRRLQLPLEDEKHMPPEGKTQLTADEVALLQHWIRDGADFGTPVADWLARDSLRPLVQHLLEADKEEKPAYDFPAASASTIKDLNTPFRTVRPLAMESPALQAEIFVRAAYQDEYLRALEAVRPQIVHLNLTNLPIGDEDLSFIASFPHLEKLILNGTDITGDQLGALQECSNLRSLALSNTRVDGPSLKALADLPALEEVFLWNTKISPAELPSLREALSGIALIDGYRPKKEEMLQLPPPMLQGSKTVLARGERVTLENKFPGAIIRYSTDGSEPDSLDGETYTDPLSFNGLLTLRAKSVKEGWLTSETVSWTFFKKGYTPDSSWLAEDPDPRYKAAGPASLFDGEKGGTTNFRNGKWMGFRQGKLDLSVDLGKAPPPVGEVVISYLQNMGSYIMPPVSIELWGGEDPQAMQRLAHRKLPVPGEYKPNQVAAETLTLTGAPHRYYRLVVQPYAKLPSWHQGSGQPGWVFVDEVFFYPSNK